MSHINFTYYKTCKEARSLNKSNYFKSKQLALKQEEWSKNYLEKLLRKICIPDDKKMSCLLETFSKKEIEEYQKNGLQILDKTITAPSLMRVVSKPIIESNTDVVENIDLRTNFYMEFMKKSKQDACCWRDKSAPNLNDLPIIQRAELFQNKLVRNFILEYRKVIPHGEFTDNYVKSLFELSSSLPVCTTFSVMNEICGTIPEASAKYLGYPEISYSGVINREINNDIEMSKQHPIQRAFGKQLPAGLRQMPFSKNPEKIWKTYSIGHEDLQSFAATFKDITDYESTRKFCLYLLKHPEVEPPDFLKKEGLLVKDILYKTVYVNEMNDEFKNVDMEEFDLGKLLHKSFSSQFKKEQQTKKGPSSTSLEELSSTHIIMV